MVFEALEYAAANLSQHHCDRSLGVSVDEELPSRVAGTMRTPKGLQRPNMSADLLSGCPLDALIPETLTCTGRSELPACRMPEAPKIRLAEPQNSSASLRLPSKPKPLPTLSLKYAEPCLSTQKLCIMCFIKCLDPEKCSHDNCPRPPQRG